MSHSHLEHLPREAHDCYLDAVGQRMAQAGPNEENSKAGV